MSARQLDLAARPFLNVRPVRRLAFALWVLGLLLAAINVRLYARSLTGLDTTQAALESESSRIAELEKSITNNSQQLRTIDLKDQNARASFLNLRIAERTFPWGDLFDRLAQVMPREVRLYSLSPQLMAETPARGSRRRTRVETQNDRVVLNITGGSEGDEPLLEFLDRLYTDPAFENPSLASETRELGQLHSFALSVVYLPAQAASNETPVFADSTLLDDGAVAATEAERFAVREAGGARTVPGGNLAAPGDSNATLPSTAASPPLTVRDRTGAGRYYGADDPRAQVTAAPTGRETASTTGTGTSQPMSRRQRANARAAAGGASPPAGSADVSAGDGGLRPYYPETDGRGAEPTALDPTASDARIRR